MRLTVSSVLLITLILCVLHSVPIVYAENGGDWQVTTTKKAPPPEQKLPQPPLPEPPLPEIPDPPPPPPEPEKPKAQAFSFAVYGDSHTYPDTHGKILDLICARKPAFIINTGDVVFNGLNDKEWRKFKQITEKVSNIPLYGTIGDHDKHVPFFVANYDTVDQSTWYSFKYENCIFIVIDTIDDFSPSSYQYSWITNQLHTVAASNTESKIFIIAHNAPYSTGAAGDENMQTALVPLFKQYHVNAVLTGHGEYYEHIYNDGIDYFITGGGGAPLSEQSKTAEWSRTFNSVHHYLYISVDNDIIDVQAYSEDDALLDAVNLSEQSDNSE